MSEARPGYNLCWIEAHVGNPGNTIRQETAMVRKILKARCPTLSVRMGPGTARNFIDIMGSEDEFGRFTPDEKSCLKSFGIETGLGGGVVMDWRNRMRFLEQYAGGSTSNPNVLDDIETKVLDALEKRLTRNLRKQIQDGLAEVFELAGCTAVGREIRAGRNVTGNAEWGIRYCMHQKTAPRVDPSTLEFTPQSEEAKILDEKIIKITNDMLETGGFPRLPSDLLFDMREKDKEFEREIAARRKERRK